MGIFDGVVQGLEQQAASAIAAKLGLDTSMAPLAIGALAKNHASAGNTVEQAAEQTGISPDILTQIVSQVGGTGGLGALVGAMTGAGAPVQDPHLPDAPVPAGGGLGGILAGMGGLGGIASAIDQDGDGNPMDEIADIAGGLFGKK
jgi:hypothetical protein